MADDSDPMADFLAREQAILGADAALFGNPMGAAANGAAISPGTLLDDIDQLVPEAKVNGGFESNNADLLDVGVGGGQAELPFLNSSNNPSFPSPIPAAEELVPEVIPAPTSQALLDWQVVFDAKVQERDAKAKEKHERMLVDAKESLERFYAEYNEKKSKSIARNKELEAQTISQMESKGNVWERVLKQIEVAPKPKVEAAPGKKNPSAIVEEKKAAKKVNNETMRFKQVLTSLKSDPNAPGLAAV